MMSAAVFPFSAPYLFRSPRGWVLRCGCCGKLEVAFGHGVLGVTDAEFACLRQTVARLTRELDQHGPHSRCRLATETGRVFLECGLDQMRALGELLDGAAAAIALQQMLDALQITTS